MLIIISSLASCKIPFPGAKLTQKEICGQRKCQPGIIGTTLIYDDEPLSFGDVSVIEPEQIARKILGRRVFNTSGLSQKCSESEYIDANHYSVEGPVNVNYSKDTRLDADVNLLVESTMNSLSHLDLSSSDRQVIKGKLSSYYNRVKNENIHIKAKYYDYFLNTDGLDAFDDGLYDSCLNMEGDFSVITAIGLVNYEVEIGNESTNQFNLDLNLNFNPEILESELKSAIKNTVTKNLSLDFPATYRIIFMRHASKDQLNPDS